MGIDAVKGLIPGVNFMEWCKAIGRPKWWAALLLVPIVNFFIYAGMCIDMVRSFGKNGFWQSVLAVIYPPIPFYSIAKNDKFTYEGPIKEKEQEYFAQLAEAQSSGNERQLKKLVNSNPFKKSGLREWAESIIFAVFAAAFIRMFLIEAYVIPTPSMEGSLLVGDFLFVSKAHYGIRTPMTVAMIPLLHNRIPGLNTESYLTNPSLPYKRLPALESIDRDDPIVFNWPVGDSVYITKKRSYTVDQVNRNKALLNYDRELKNLKKKKDFVVRPIDKKDHYIKRCVAEAGDSLEIRNGQVYINGKIGKNPEHLQFLYQVKLPNGSVSSKKLDQWGIGQSDIFGDKMFLDNEQVEKLKSLGNGVTVQIIKNSKDPSRLFPHDPKNFPDWSVDDFGPIWIPKAGSTTNLNMQNIALYKRIIDVYENNDLKIKGNEIFINGNKATSYTFKQNYYWAMGDNRHNSEDSRAWGYVPHDHIVGKPLFIWFSTKDGSIGNGIRWNRIFKSANVK